MDDILEITFKNEFSLLVEESNLAQWDRGQKLKINGLDIKEDVQVHFSLDEHCGDAERMIGQVTSGSILVDIPAFIMEGEGGCEGYYYAYAFVYITEGDIAETIRKIAFPVKTRPKPADYARPPEPDVLVQLKAEIVRDVLNTLPKWEGGSY